MADANIKFSRVKIIISILYILMYPVLLFAIAGDIFWIEGWVFSIYFLLNTFLIFLYLYLKDPALLAERFKITDKTSQKLWDKYLLGIVTITYFIWFVIMPLDAKRFAWTLNFPLCLEIIGGIFLILSSIIMLKSLADNTFTSALVRIQKERNQYVVSTGIYSIVRHPMYLGALFMFFGVPMLLGSIYGILLAIFLAFLFILRIFGEEKMLVDELEGYIEYKKKVKYRLIPLIW